MQVRLFCLLAWTFMMLPKPSDNITVAVDGTGGDEGACTVAGALKLALQRYPALKFLIFGPKSLHDDVIKAGVDSKHYEFIRADITIPQDEEPKKVLKLRQGSAMAMALKAVKEGRAQAVVSGGGTGPLVTLARHILGTIGHLHPALCARMPKGEGEIFLMLDLGANSQGSFRDLTGFARLGAAAACCVLNTASPSIALLNVGTEAGKGPLHVRQARDMLASLNDLNFKGFIEADRIFRGDVDVIVTDGFTGNIALKAAEGVAGIYAAASCRQNQKSFADSGQLNWLQPWKYNGSLLLGVNGIVVKSHAGAKEEAVAAAMAAAAVAVEKNLVERIKSSSYLKDCYNTPL